MDQIFAWGNNVSAYNLLFELNDPIMQLHAKVWMFENAQTKAKNRKPYSNPHVVYYGMGIRIPIYQMTIAETMFNCAD